MFCSDSCTSPLRAGSVVCRQCKGTGFNEGDITDITGCVQMTLSWRQFSTCALILTHGTTPCSLAILPPLLLAQCSMWQVQRWPIGGHALRGFTLPPHMAPPCCRGLRLFFHALSVAAVELALVPATSGAPLTEQLRAPSRQRLRDCT